MVVTDLLPSIAKQRFTSQPLWTTLRRRARSSVSWVTLVIRGLSSQERALEDEKNVSRGKKK